MACGGLLLLLAGAPTTAAQEEEAAPSRPIDVVFTDSGAAVPGRILYIDEDSERLRMRVILEGPRGIGTATRDVPLAQIRAITFAPIAGEREALADPAAVPIESLRDLWNTLRRHASRPRSSTGRLGLAYARRLVEEESPHWLDEALAVFETLADEAWHPAVRAEARAGALRVKLLLDRLEEAEAEAERLAEETDDPALLIEARHVLALAGHRRLEQWIAEHPRWREDDEVRPGLLRLFHESVDRFLYAPLFHGSREHESARGLWHARESALLMGASDEAAGFAEDLAGLYPNSAFARKLVEEP